LILDEAEAFFFSKGFQGSQTPQTRQQPISVVPAQQTHLPGRQPYLIAQAIVYYGQPAAGRQQARLNGEKNIRIGAVRVGFNGIGKVGFEPVGRKLQKTFFFEMNPVPLGFGNALPGGVDLERAQADARKGSNPGEPPDEIKNAAPHPATQVQHPVDGVGAPLYFPGNQLVGVVHRRGQGVDLRGPQGTVEVEGALIFSPLEEAPGVMVVILPDLSKMVCSAHVVHRTPLPKTFDL